MVKAPFVQERDSRLGDGRAVNVGVGGRVPEVIDVKVSLCGLGAHHLDVADAAPIDGGGIRDHQLHREMPAKLRELLGHVIGHPGGRGGQRAPDRELQRRDSVSASIT